MEKNIEKLLNNHKKVADDFLAMVEYLKKYPECSSILKLLTCDKMVVYKLLRTCSDNLESMFGLFSSLQHAFLDDGEFHVVREIDTSVTNHRERFNKFLIDNGKEPLYDDPTYYDYYIKPYGDYNSRPISNKQLGDLIDAFQKGYDFYGLNEEAIEAWENQAYNEWRSIEEEAENMLKTIYEESKYL